MDEQERQGVGHRVLPVTVDVWTVMDMNGPVCDAGETVEVILEFREQDPGHPGLADMIVTVDAWAQEYPDAAPVDPERMTWNTLLTGDGWSARWDSPPRPVLGHVRPTGTFHRESLYPHETKVVPTRGSLTRIRTLHGRGEAPRIAEVDRIWKSDADGESDIRAFLVDLDLDAASRPDPDDLQRPCIVHGFAVTGTSGKRAFWRGDRRLPLVWRTDLATGETMAVALPLRVNDAEMYLVRVQGPLTGSGGGPAEDSCRVVTVDRPGVRRHFIVRGAGTFVEDTVSSRPAFSDEVGQSVPAPGTLNREDAGWIVSRYDELSNGIHMPVGGMYGWPVSSGVQRLGRADADGTVTWIREWEVGESDTTASLLTAGGHVLLWQDGVVQYLDRELEVVGDARLPEGLPSEVRYSPRVSGGFPVVSGGGVLAVLDPSPASVGGPPELSVILQVDVGAWAHAQVDDEATIWVADSRSRPGEGDRLRLFTRDAAGEWTGREVTV